MPRLWDVDASKSHTKMSMEEAESMANTEALRASIENAPHWTLDDVLTEIGGSQEHRNQELARQLLAFKGNDHPTRKQIDGQMRSIQRWIRYEGGLDKGAKPSKASQNMLNRAGRNAQAARDGFTIAMNGDIEVNGYRRPDRTASIRMSGDRAISFLNNPNWGDLAAAYGADSLHAFGDVQIDISW